MVGLLGSWVEWLVGMRCRVVEALLVRLRIVGLVGSVPPVWIGMRWSWCGRGTEEEERRYNRSLQGINGVDAELSTSA